MSGNYNFGNGSREGNSAGGAAGEEVPVFVEPVDSVNQVDHVDQDDGVLVMGVHTIQDDQHDGKAIDEGAKEDMFVDCPDELLSNDGRISVTENSHAIESSEPQQGFQGDDDMWMNRSSESGNWRQDDNPTVELEYEAERRLLIQGLANLKQQLNALNMKKSMVNENDSGFTDHYESETGKGEKQSVISDAPLQEMVSDCSKLIKHAMDEHSHTQATIEELHAILHKKDQEIQDLSARVTESSVLQDIEATVDRILNSLASTTNQEELQDESFTQKMFHIETSTLLIIDKYNSFLSESELLRQSLTEIRSDHFVQDEMRTLFLTAREELLELRRKEIDLTQKMTELEDANSKLVDQLKKNQEIVDTATAEIEKLKVELDHEKARYSNTKEKLSLAVTKGKGLVQQRDSLKQSLADKNSELEKVILELQEKSSALEAAELAMEELVKNETLTTSLQEALLERNTIIKTCVEILSESHLTEEIQSMDIIERVRWLTQESNKLMGISLEFQNIANALSSIVFPENMPALNLESQVIWLAESFFAAKEEVAKLQNEISGAREAAHNDIDRLTASIIAETQENFCLQQELENLRHKYEKIVEREHHISSERDWMVRRLHEVSGMAMDGPELHPDIDNIINHRFRRLKEQTGVSIEYSHVEVEIFQRIQSLLYIRDQEAMLFEKILEEEMSDRSEANHLANKIVMVSQEVHNLKNDKESLQNDLSRLEEKASLLREKLSMAVKKGKGLVQERENMKQLLDRTRETAHNEIDRLTASILVETQEKNYLEEELEDLRYKYAGIVEKERQISLDKERMVRMLCEASGIAMESPEDIYSSMDIIVDRCFGKFKEQTRVSIESSHMEILERIQSLLYMRDQEAMLLEKILEEEMQDRFKVNDQAKKIEVVAHELHDLKDEKEALQNELSRSKEKANVLRDKLSVAVKKGKGFFQERENMKQLLDKTTEAADKEIDRLAFSIFSETVEKYYLQQEYEDLTYKYEGIVEKEHKLLFEMDQMVRMLHEASGIAMDGPEELHSDMGVVIDRCFGKLKEQIRVSTESSHVEDETYARIQSLLYIKDYEALLFEKILYEEMLDRSELGHKIVLVSQELRDLKGEKDSLQNDLSHSEEKATLLREKLSMAVKKGKGLVQERENMKQLLEEKNASIHKLKMELEQQELTHNNFRNEINKLSADVACIPQLEVDFISVKEQRDQLEQFLAESNRMLQSLIESIDSIILPEESAIEEPVEKVKWLAGYLIECQTAKARAQQELKIVKGEVSTLFNNLAEVQTTMRSLEDELSVAKSNISQLAEEKREVEVAKKIIEQELQKAMEKASSETLKFSEVSANSKSFEDALALSENRISVLTEEKEDAQVYRAAAEKELHKVKEEASFLTSKLAEAHRTIKFLEDEMHQVQTNFSLLAEENNVAQVGRKNMEYEVEKLKEESDLQASKLADASSTIKSFEEALRKSENTISDLIADREDAAREVSDLKLQLNAYMQELDGNRDVNKNRSLELSAYLNNLQLLLKDDTLLSFLKQSFVKKIEGLKDIKNLLEGIEGHFNGINSDVLHNSPVSEEDPFAANLFPAGFDNFGNIEMINGEFAGDHEDLTLYIGKMVDYLQKKDKAYVDIFENSSSVMDDIIASLSTKLVATKEKLMVMIQHMKSVKQQVNNMEMDKQAQYNALETVENSVAILLSDCRDAIQELELEVENNLLELDSVPELKILNHSLSPDIRIVGEDAETDPQIRLHRSDYLKTSEKLLSGVRTIQKLIKQFQYIRNKMAEKVKNLEGKLKESSSTLEKVIEEKDFHQNRVLKLEADLKELDDLCGELRLRQGEHLEKENKTKEREAELMSMYSTPMRERESEDPLMSTSQLKSLFNKIDGIEIPSTEFEVGELESSDPDHVKKLFHVINCIDGLQHQITLLSHTNQLQQSKLENQVLEIEQLKEEVAKHYNHKQGSENMKHELFELAIGLENIIQRLGGDETGGIQKTAGVGGQLLILERLVTATIKESENSKFKAQELDAKILQTQEVMDKLSSKVKFLEKTNGRETSEDPIQERGVSEAPTVPTQSEILEIEDVGPRVNIPMPPAPTNAHVRTLRKGSSDHLAINIDSESDRLINTKDKDEDKGHVFKSLNTSGLVPRQGRMIADRIDGIWVSGDRALMSRPRARLGLIAYWLFLNLWLLGTIL